MILQSMLFSLKEFELANSHYESSIQMSSLRSLLHLTSNAMRAAGRLSASVGFPLSRLCGARTGPGGKMSDGCGRSCGRSEGGRNTPSVRGLGSRPSYTPGASGWLGNTAEGARQFLKRHNLLALLGLHAARKWGTTAC